MFCAPWTQGSWPQRRAAEHDEIAHYGTLKTWAGERSA